MSRTALFVSGLVITAVASAQAATLKFDFGDPGATQMSAGNINNLYHTLGGTSLTDCVDVNGNLTGIQMLNADAFWPGSNYNGTSSPTGAAAALFPGTATMDNFFGSVTPFGNPPFTEPTGGYQIRGLDPTGNTTYAFTFFGSRMGVSDNRETAYAVAGANSATAYLNTSNNSSEVATVSGLIPNAQGRITLTVGPGPNNTNASKFYYFAAMQLVSSPVPEPVSLSALALGGLMLKRRR